MIDKKELIEIIEGCVYNSQVLTEERVCFNELRKELNEELPEQLTLTDVVKSLPIERPKLTTSYAEFIQKKDMTEEYIKSLQKEIRDIRVENERLENAIKELNSIIAYVKNSGNIHS